MCGRRYTPFFFKGDAVDTTFCACGFVHHDCIVRTLISYRVCLLFFLLYDAYKFNVLDTVVTACKEVLLKGDAISD